MHFFPERTFRQVSVSEYCVTESSETVRILLIDVSRGLYLYQIQIVPDFQVMLVGKYILGPGDGFISTFVLGREGKRGVWVERNSGGTHRKVFAFFVPPMQQEVDDGGRSWPLVGRVIYEVKSYDLRGMRAFVVSIFDVSLTSDFDVEDITHCAVSEFDGRVVLGTRAGEIHILECCERPRAKI